MSTEGQNHNMTSDKTFNTFHHAYAPLTSASFRPRLTPCQICMILAMVTTIPLTIPMMVASASICLPPRSREHSSGTLVHEPSNVGVGVGLVMLANGLPNLAVHLPGDEHVLGVVVEDDARDSQ